MAIYQMACELIHIFRSILAGSFVITVASRGKMSSSVNVAVNLVASQVAAHVVQVAPSPLIGILGDPLARKWYRRRIHGRYSIGQREPSVNLYISRTVICFHSFFFIFFTSLYLFQ